MFEFFKARITHYSTADDKIALPWRSDRCGDGTSTRKKSESIAAYQKRD